MEKTAGREMHIRRRVLVVDDELVNRRLLGFIVSRDYEVLYAENGAQALEMIRENEASLSLILLDLLMPELDGYELLGILHHDPVLRRIPVIVLTSEKSAEVRSLQLGAADFIPKPYDLPEVILARVHRSIELAEDNIIIGETETDALTGLYNRDFFYQYVSRCDRFQPDVQMDALVLDVNRFHLINEMHGREYGDRVLLTITDIIRLTLDEMGGLACRAGADTFYIYIPHREDYAALLDSSTEYFAQQLDNSRISLRLGVYENADRNAAPEMRFDRALLACTTLRHSYSTGFAYYDTKLREQEIYNERLISDMEQALAEKQFRVFYQPKYNIKGEHPVLTSAEALIRWFHPELGFISPGTFIPLFEENGLVQKLDHFVWKEAAAQIARWKKAYGVTLPVSVNVSRIDIYDPALEETLLDIVKTNGLEPSELLLEITESAYTDNSQQIIEKVNRLRADGFRVEMDDFGSGYSSLNMLAALPIDALKLDMVFVRHICENEKDQRMVELMIEIAAFLGVPVISEGVETKEQLDLLKKLGCDIIQGYYFSKPVPPEEFAKRIEAEQH